MPENSGSNGNDDQILLHLPPNPTMNRASVSLNLISFRRWLLIIFLLPSMYIYYLPFQIYFGHELNNKYYICWWQLIAEMLGTYFMVFAGCAAQVVNLNNDNVVTLPGIAIVWGLVVMVLRYSLFHISGAHFNPSVTIAFATCKRFPCKQVNYVRH